MFLFSNNRMIPSSFFPQTMSVVLIFPLLVWDHSKFLIVHFSFASAFLLRILDHNYRVINIFLICIDFLLNNPYKSPLTFHSMFGIFVFV